MKKIILIMTVVLVAAFALPTKAQSFGTEQPNATFQSTSSSMMNSGSAYSSNPTLNTDGTASYNGASKPSGPRRAKKTDDDNDGYDDETGLPVTPGTSGTQQPLGDAVLPLLLMSLAFCGVLYMRKRKAQASTKE